MRTTGEARTRSAPEAVAGEGRAGVRLEHAVSDSRMRETSTQIETASRKRAHTARVDDVFARSVHAAACEKLLELKKLRHSMTYSYYTVRP